MAPSTQCYLDQCYLDLCYPEVNENRYILLCANHCNIVPHVPNTTALPSVGIVLAGTFYTFRISLFCCCNNTTNKIVNFDVLNEKF